jgi:hypothetical protein
MALMRLLLIIGLFFGFDAQANRALDAKVYQEAFRAYQSKSHTTSLRVIRDQYDLMNNQGPTPILLLAALNYEALSEYAFARNIYEAIIKRLHQERHQQIVSQYKADGNAFSLPDVPLPLAQLYERLAEVEFKLLEENYKSLTQDQRTLREELITMYGNICLEYECDDVAIDNILSSVAQMKLENDRQKHQWRFAVTMSYVSFKDVLNLTNDSQEFEVTTTARGPCFGVELARGSYYFESALGFCFARTKANASHQSDLVRYLDTEVSLNVLQLTPSARWRPKGPGAAIGFDIPFTYRTGAFEEPDNLELRGNKAFNIGVGFSLHWNLQNFSYMTRMAKMRGYQSSYFELGIKYFF